MNDKETLTPWEPLEGFTYDYYIYSVCSDSNGLKVILDEINDGKRSVMITFPEGFLTCRMTDDFIGRNLLQVEGELTEEEREDTRSYPCTLFKATNSEYLKWANQKLDGTNKYFDLSHYVVWTADWVLEVLSTSEPIVEFINIP